LITIGASRDGQRFAMALKENDEVGHAPVIDVRIGMSEEPVPLPRIRGEVALHILMNFFLKINAHYPVRADDLIGTHSGVGGHIATPVRNANIGGIVTDGVVGTFNGRVDQRTQELLVRERPLWI
jgi:hypothetical protein